MGLFKKLTETISGQTEVNLPFGRKKEETHEPNEPSRVESAAFQSAPATQQPASDGGLYDAELEQLIDLALADGELTEKEKQVLFKRAQAQGIDLDEFEMVLDARLYKLSQQQQSQQVSSSAPKSDKYGDIKKCPACGAMIPSFTASCPECGYEFKNIAANSSIQRLFEMLNQAELESKEDAKGLMEGLGRSFGESFSAGMGGNKDTRKKKAIIQNFPIPNTKDDILEFLSLAVPLARKPKWNNPDMNAREMYPVWKAKCEQIIMKAKFSMREDKQTLEMIAEYANELNIKM